jgi:HK97 family phage major capsid protein
MEPREIRQKMNELWARMKDIDQAAVAEKRTMTQEETNNWNAADKELNQLEEQLGRAERMQSLNGRLGSPEGKVIVPGDEDPEGRRKDPNDPIPKAQVEKRKKAWEKYLRFGEMEMSHEERTAAKEYRDLQRDINTAGGYLMAPFQFVQDLIKTVDNMVYVRQLAQTFQLANAQSLSFPVRTARMGSAAWTAEVEASQPDDTGLTFGLRTFQPNKLSKKIKASNTLLRMSPMGPDQIIIDEFKYLFATTFEQAYISGSGAGQPLGMFVASQKGLYTDRDVVMSGSISGGLNWFDSLINTQTTLKDQYQPNAQWFFHRTTLGQIKLAKSTTNFYIWQPPTNGAPPTILGRPYISSEYVPNTYGSTNQYVGMYADFKQMYRIVDSLDMELIRLNELYQDTDQTGFICRMWSDGAPVLSEAAARMITPNS